ncbi:hypothetical protein [Nonomuraea typhae]|uniref:hypothetical protein n=1 Tax=Nonomuraea typhae TaxID=2603600 RepID=UPI0012F8DD93|nr:hypothetical protein [Nonomuraea typhae]
MSCIDDAVVSRGMDRGFGQTVYRHLSSVAHGAEAGLVGSLLEIAVAGTHMTFGKNAD